MNPPGYRPERFTLGHPVTGTHPENFGLKSTIGDKNLFIDVGSRNEALHHPPRTGNMPGKDHLTIGGRDNRSCSHHLHLDPARRSASNTSLHRKRRNESAADGRCHQ